MQLSDTNAHDVKQPGFRLHRSARRKARRAFTLLEAALATVIIGVGVLALVEAQATFSKNNDFSTNSATAAYLANEIRERMRGLPRHDPVTGLFVQGSGQTATLVGWGRDAGEVTPADFDDIDDFDGVVFGPGETFSGPIDAFNRVIPNTRADGTIETNEEGLEVPMRGWRQRVTVTKVDPFNFSLTRAQGFSIAPSAGNPGVPVDGFPLRVTVSVTYQGPLDLAPQEMARVVWIVP